MEKRCPICYCIIDDGEEICPDCEMDKALLELYVEQ
ncbi:RNA polymerase subunit RPABC4/transcription elongation factor Spt4 [Carboxydothermus ferrireducens DSM 11255]|uniref:Uncharacterized protein n=2 Tax=Carboxydothermus TaxID=129957 RepID=Q3ABB0_CARHZ|nr:hypothetical protein CHY_1754 [Carboxydothermus hydrogenoformans Z-2901]NYE58457.1 RNA polymerase subunit RPABC4/transcription elongation factor Spt4 [Carboxydothermus ferrireducens DSM 11255]